MKTSDFDFDLPNHLIAQFPVSNRGQSRLMTLDRVTGKRLHKMIDSLPEILLEDHFLSPEGEKPLLVFNDTKVRKARLIGISETTFTKEEFLLLENMEKENDNSCGSIWKAMVKRAKRKKIGSKFIFYDTNENIVSAIKTADTSTICDIKTSHISKIAEAEIININDGFVFLQFDCLVDNEWLDKYGHIPLPPYIKRKDISLDSERYQTIYAKETGSAAAPTAGLHFTKEIMENLANNGIETDYVTLHVGLGTFLPVRSANIEDHKMHEEQFLITKETALKIEQAKTNGRKIIAVGTTSLRSLESAFNNGKIRHGWQKTNIFIYPGYDFRVVDALFTNFHTPLSTLLMLVSAFAGKELILESYAEAVKKEYRFFSYGDAMLIY